LDTRNKRATIKDKVMAKFYLAAIFYKEEAFTERRLALMIISPSVNRVLPSLNIRQVALSEESDRVGVAGKI
jgi:hypothetical protein